MKRRIRITFAPDTMTCSATYSQVDQAGNETAIAGENDYSLYERTEEYGNQLYNGEIEVIDPTGKSQVYTDGCHLVQREPGWITAMDKPTYEAFSGRPGSGNED